MTMPCSSSISACRLMSRRAETSKPPVSKIWLPMWLIRSVARLAETSHLLGAPQPLLTLRGVNNLAESSRLSIAKAQRDLGYQPRIQQANGMATLLLAARNFAATHGKSA